MIYKVFLNDVDVSYFTILPFDDQIVRDKTLDVGSIELRGTQIGTPIEPLSKIKFTIEDDVGGWAKTYLVQHDDCSKNLIDGTFDHVIYFIEQTKWLERFLVVNRSITNKLSVMTFNEINSILIDPPDRSAIVKRNVKALWGLSVGKREYEYYNTQGYTNYVYTNTKLRILSANEFVNETNFPREGIVDALQSDNIGTDYQLKVEYNGQVWTTGNLNDGYELSVPLIGKVRIQYSGYHGILRDTLNTITLTVNVVPPKEEVSIQEKLLETKTWMFDETVDRLLAVCETLRESQAPRFVLNSYQREELHKIEVPEQDFNGTLLECLEQLGELINAVPRLDGNEIYFDENTVDEICEIDDTKIVSDISSSDVAQFASSLDTIAQNAVFENAVITDPFPYGATSLRAESGVVQITDENCMIPTKYPIYRIKSLKVCYTDKNRNEELCEISGMVCEKTVYDTKSSFDDSINDSKNYSLYYTFGTRNIYGLGFKLSSIFSFITKDSAIKEIVQYFSSQKIDNPLFITFRIQYIPIINFRARQYKQLPATTQSTLVYNQTSNVVNSDAYGRAMSSMINRLGNAERTVLLHLKNVNELRNIKVGYKFDKDWYISSAKFEYYNDFIVASLGLTKNAAKQSEFIGINSEERFYEISEKNTKDTYILYEDFMDVANMSDVFGTVWTPFEVWTDDDKFERGEVYSLDKETVFEFKPKTFGLKKFYHETNELIDAEEDYPNLPYSPPYFLPWIYVVASEDVDKLPFEIKDFESWEVVLNDKVYYGVTPATIGAYRKDYTISDVNNSLMIQGGLVTFADSFNSETWFSQVTSMAKISTYFGEHKMSTIVLPVESFIFGDSIGFTFRLEDNFSAGKQVFRATGLSQYDTPYSNQFGQVDSIDIDIGWVGDGDIPTSGEKAKTRQDLSISLGDTLPSADFIGGMVNLMAFHEQFATLGDKIRILKDNREVPIITYQIHLRNKSKDIIIKNSFLSNLGYVNRESEVDESKTLCELLAFKSRFDDDVENITGVSYEKISDVAVYTSPEHGVAAFLRTNLQNYPKRVGNFKSWAIVKNGKILFKKNVDFTDGDSFDLPCVKFTHEMEG